MTSEKGSHVTEVKVGDKYEYVDGIAEVLCVGEFKAFVKLADGEEGVWYLFGFGSLKKVEPFFEVGKTYRHADHGDVFEVRCVDAIGDRRIAFGRSSWPDEDQQHFSTRRNFDGYEEVKDSE
jgi:hypothetical protein